MMSCLVSAADSRLRRVFPLLNLVLDIVQSNHKCKESKKHVECYIRLAREIGFRWFYKSKGVKNDFMQRFCSWSSVSEGVSAVQLCFMYKSE